MKIGGHPGLGGKRETLAAQGKAMFLLDASDMSELPFKQRVAGSNPARLTF
jgi:hypothetical protein